MSLAGCAEHRAAPAAEPVPVPVPVPGEIDPENVVDADTASCTDTSRLRKNETSAETLRPVSVAGVSD
ncbi:hypothetical protein ACFDTO_07510 [Microbacteriaceae bacterium 4G12]